MGLSEEVVLQLQWKDEKGPVMQARWGRRAEEAVGGSKVPAEEITHAAPEKT